MKPRLVGFLAGLLVLPVQGAEGPPEIEVPAASAHELTPSNGWPAHESYRAWERSLGGPTSARFSSLRQINRANVARLQPAWTYRSGDGQSSIQCNPIVAGDRLFTPTPGKNLVALDAATGQELWRFQPENQGVRHEDNVARRGLLFWPGDGQAAARLIFTAGNWIYAVDPATGARTASFGVDGRTPIPTGGCAGGAIWRGLLVIPGFHGDVFGYDAATGELRWRFYTIAREGEPGGDTWEGRQIGANCWGGMALDESRGIAYVATGSPKPNFNGMGHLGDNLFANCVIALDVATGKRLWHFQEVRHDIWDLDIPAPPNLVTVSRDGKRYDVVAQVTKLGNTLLLDRVTGKPLFPYKLRRAPASKLPGERASLYQPVFALPTPFARQFVFPEEDITDRTPAARAFVLERMGGSATTAWFEPPEPGKMATFYGIDGGAEWTGAAYDPTTSRLYVTANEIPWTNMMIPNDEPPPAVPATRGEQVYQQSCSACHGPTRIGSGVAPALRGLRHRLSDEQVLAILKSGRGLMPPAPPLTEPERDALVDFLQARDRPPLAMPRLGPPSYMHGADGRLLDDEGYPGCKPPWGTLSCLDLDTGQLRWKVPLGEYAALTRLGIPRTGTPNLGGAIVTEGGIVFCSGTLDNRVRAFDANTGDELWSASLPFHGTAPPTTYEVAGRQYLVVPATGGGKVGGPVGDAWVAFALPVAAGRDPK